MNDKPTAITKVLSSNDTGETGGHQAGMLIPKESKALAFFPNLGNDSKNPRTSVYFYDEANTIWKFNFIYYNNSFFDKEGTRNEYRLTGMTAWFREKCLKAGDSVTLTHDEDGIDRITFSRATQGNVAVIMDNEGHERKRLVLGSGWKVIRY